METGRVSQIEGIKDIAVRAIKAFLAYVIGANIMDLLRNRDLAALEDVLYAGAGAGLLIITNAILKWTQTP